MLAARLSPVLIAALAVEPCVAQLPPVTTVPAQPTANDSVATILAGISNQGRNKQQPYVTAGDRTYLIGTQDGNFPDMGQHVPDEMGGLWLPPIKLIDGFEARIAEAGTEKEVLLSESAEMVAHPYGNRFEVSAGCWAIWTSIVFSSVRIAIGPDRPIPFQEHIGSCATLRVQW